MEALQDSTSKERLWERGDTQYYSKGVTDPDYCVLRFTAQAGITAISKPGILWWNDAYLPSRFLKNPANQKLRGFAWE